MTRHPEPGFSYVAFCSLCTTIRPYNFMILCPNSYVVQYYVVGQYCVCLCVQSRKKFLIDFCETCPASRRSYSLEAINFWTLPPLGRGPSPKGHNFPIEFPILTFEFLEHNTVTHRNQAKVFKGLTYFHCKEMGSPFPKFCSVAR